MRLFRFLLGMLFFLTAVSASAIFTVNVPVRDGVTRHQVTARGELYTPDDMKYVMSNQISDGEGRLVFLFKDRPPRYKMRVYAVNYVKKDDGKTREEESEEYDEQWIDFDVPENEGSPYEHAAVYLDRHRERNLKEVTVTASRVMFYHKGDTLVYNASAFVLAEGSMLDALIRQMPGVELRKNGEIYCNGRKVDNLLLNGKDMFNGNKELMLQNLAAYTVKNIAVYDKQSRTSELMGQNTGGGLHVMDVRLKRQYSHGWLVNAEAGYGSSERYMGRLFASWFSDNVSVSMFGGSNNLSDYAQPGDNNDAWSSANSGDGVATRNQGGLLYNARGSDDLWEMKGDVKVTDTRQYEKLAITTENFLPGRNFYDYSWNNSDRKVLNVSSAHEFFSKIGRRVNLTVVPKFSYNKSETSESRISASFREKIEDISPEFIKNLFSNAGEDSDNVLNRAVNEESSSTHGLDASLSVKTDINIKPKGQRQMLSLRLESSHHNDHGDAFDRYAVSYGADEASSQSYRRHFKNHPNHRNSAEAEVEFTQFFDYHMSRLPISYTFRYDNRKNTSEVYLLNTVESGLTALPSSGEYEQGFDAGLSYVSRQTDRRHIISISPGHSLAFSLGGQDSYSMMILPYVGLEIAHRSYFYNTGSGESDITRTDILPSANLGLYFRNHMRAKWNYHLRFYTKTREADMTRLVDRPVTDPLMRLLGNPGLKNQSEYTIRFEASYENKKKLSHNVGLRGIFYHNAQVSSFSYDTDTGVKSFTTNNVNGNYVIDGSYRFFTPFGAMNRFDISTASQAGLLRNRDFEGEVKVCSFKENLRFNWLPGKFRFSLLADIDVSRYMYHDKPLDDFTSLTCNYGASAVLNLPYNWGFSSDLTLYTRRGFTDSRLNTTDLVWNARLTKSVLKGSLVFIVDGYDILRQLSNVSYTVNAQARTEVVSNVIPAYVLMHVQFRFNKQPKKR